MILLVETIELGPNALVAVNTTYGLIGLIAILYAGYKLLKLFLENE